MSNTFFKFKQFNVNQDKCSMKVCTDACLLGAWSAAYLQNHQPSDQILDIGTGTGLLSLMLSQVGGAIIHAVEIDEEAFQQADANFKNSPWGKKLSVFNEGVQHFNQGIKYDFLISNPPFFENQLRSPNKNKNDAKHSTALNLTELVVAIAQLMNENGKAAVLLPYDRRDYFKKEVSDVKLFVEEELIIRHTSAHDPFRIIFLLGRKETEASVKEMVIMEPGGNYSEVFTQLLKPYYLSL